MGPHPAVHARVLLVRQGERVRDVAVGVERGLAYVASVRSMTLVI